MRQEFTGKTLVLLDTGLADTIDISIEIGGYAVEELRGVKKGLKVQAPGFTAARFFAPVDCTLEVVVSEANISVNYQDGSTVNANIIGTVPVSNDRGAPAAPLYVVGVTYTDAPALTMQDNAAVAVTDAGAALVAANPNRRSLRFANIGLDPVAIGATGITWAKRCIVLNAGDTWIEDRAANMAWAADCDTSKTANVTVQEVIS